MLLLIIKLSTLSLGLSNATPTNCQSQMAALTERMNQMISSLYSLSPLSKLQSTSSGASTSSSDEQPPATASSYDSTSYSYPYATPQIVYVAAPPSLPLTPIASNTYYSLDTTSPVEYNYPGSSKIPRSPKTYTYDYAYPHYPPPLYPPAPYPPLYPPQDYHHPEAPLAPYPHPVPPSPLPPLYPPVPVPIYPPVPFPTYPPMSIPSYPPIPVPSYPPGATPYVPPSYFRSEVRPK